MNHAVSCGNLKVVRQKTINNTKGIYYPITIYFEKELTDSKMEQLAVLAEWIQDREKGKCADTRSEQDENP